MLPLYIDPTSGGALMIVLYERPNNIMSHLTLINAHDRFVHTVQQIYFAWIKWIMVIMALNNI